MGNSIFDCYKLREAFNSILSLIILKIKVYLFGGIFFTIKKYQNVYICAVCKKINSFYNLKYVSKWYLFNSALEQNK
jgi:hypothetical protein